ncbi:unnamed protein product [Zymoseptoria tritici ST99CH_1A5]|uniref:Uncharacterized protein n=1 Tax=Zymoseptoria tritici ST99CH_1A5 TaxID=1276529 RepID=A0A1Y6LQC6_ZYMTR|nr:unnamed protein product [Zymoseptoria tritici ST99CH_1A5]
MHHWKNDKNKGKPEGEKIEPGSLKIWDMGGNKKNKKGKTPASKSASEAGSGTPTQPPQPPINTHVGARLTPNTPAGAPSIPTPSTRLDSAYNHGTPNRYSSDEDDTDEDDDPKNCYSDGEHTEAYRDKIATKAFRRYKKYGEDALQGVESQLLYDAIQDLIIEEGGVGGVDTEARDAEKVSKERERRARWSVEDGKAKSQDDLKQKREIEKQHQARKDRESARILADVEDDIDKDFKAPVTLDNPALLLRGPPSDHIGVASDYDRKKSNKKPEPGPEERVTEQTQETPGRKIAKPRPRRPGSAGGPASAANVSGPGESPFANFNQQADPSTPQTFPQGNGAVQARDKDNMEVELATGDLPAPYDPQAVGDDNSGAYSDPDQFAVQTGPNLTVNTSDGPPFSYPDPQEDPQNTSPYNVAPRPNSALNYTSAFSPDPRHGAQGMPGFGEFPSGESGPPSGPIFPQSGFDFAAPLPGRESAQPSNIDPQLLGLGGANPGPSAPAVSLTPVMDHSSTAGTRRVPERKKSGDTVRPRAGRRNADRIRAESIIDSGPETVNPYSTGKFETALPNAFGVTDLRNSLPTIESAAPPQVDRDGDQAMKTGPDSDTETTRKIPPSGFDEDPMEHDGVSSPRVQPESPRVQPESPRYQPESPSTYPKPEEMEIDSNKEASRGPKENPQNVSSGGYYPKSPPRDLLSSRKPSYGRTATYDPEYQRNSNDATTSGVGGSNGPSTTPRSPESTDPFGGNYFPPVRDTAMEPYKTCGDEDHDELVKKINVALKSEAEAKDKVKDYDRMKRELDESKKPGKTEEKNSEKCKAKCTTLEKELAKVRAEFDAFKSQHQDCTPLRKDNQKIVQSTTPSSKTSNPGPVKLQGLKDSMYAKSPPPEQDADVEMGEDGMDNDLKKAKEDLEKAKKAALKAEGDLQTARGEHSAAQNILQAAKEAAETKLRECKEQAAQLMAQNNELYKEASIVQAEHNQCGQKQMVAVAGAEEAAKTDLEKSKKKQAELEKEKKTAAEKLQKLQTEHARCKKNQADALAAAAKKCDEEKAALGPPRRKREPGEKRPERCTVQRHREYKEMIRMAAEATTSMVDAVTRMQNSGLSLSFNTVIWILQHGLIGKHCIIRGQAEVKAVSRQGIETGLEMTGNKWTSLHGQRQVCVLSLSARWHHIRISLRSCHSSAFFHKTSTALPSPIRHGLTQLSSADGLVPGEAYLQRR